MNFFVILSRGLPLREIRNFPYPSVFELTGPKGWPLKKEIRM